MYIPMCPKPKNRYPLQLDSTDGRAEDIPPGTDSHGFKSNHFQVKVTTENVQYKFAINKVATISGKLPMGVACTFSVLIIPCN